jgi:hypothetical protein
MERSLPALMRRAARLTAVSLAKQAQPFGTNNDAKLMGQKAVVRDIRRVYALPSDVYEAIDNRKIAAGFWAAVSKGDWARATTIMQKNCPLFHSKQILPFDGGSAHQAARVRGKIKAKQSVVFVVQKSAELKAYIQKEFDLVGWGKAGWAACARALGGVSGLPKWITRHSAPGSVIENYGGGRAEVTITNQVSYATAILNESQKKEAVDIAGRNLFKALQIEERKAAQAAGF